MKKIISVTFAVIMLFGFSSNIVTSYAAPVTASASFESKDNFENGKKVTTDKYWYNDQKQLVKYEKVYWNQSGTEVVQSDTYDYNNQGQITQLNIRYFTETGSKRTGEITTQFSNGIRTESLEYQYSGTSWDGGTPTRKVISKYNPNGETLSYQDAIDYVNGLKTIEVKKNFDSNGAITTQELIYWNKFGNEVTQSDTSTYSNQQLVSFNVRYFTETGSKRTHETTTKFNDNVRTEFEETFYLGNDWAGSTIVRKNITQYYADGETPKFKSDVKYVNGLKNYSDDYYFSDAGIKTKYEQIYWNKYGFEITDSNSFFYDADLNLTKSITLNYTETGSFRTRGYTTFYENNRIVLTEECFYVGDAYEGGNLTKKITTTYEDGMNKAVVLTQYYENGVLKTGIENTYDQEGNIIATKEYKY